MMNTTFQLEWPTTPRRVRKRRDSRVAYHHNPKYFHRNVAVPSTAVPPPRNFPSQPSVQVHQQSLPGQSSHVNSSNFWDFPGSPDEQQPLDQRTLQDGQAEIPWQSSLFSYNYPRLAANSPHSPNDNTPSPQVGQAQLFTHDNTPSPKLGQAQLFTPHDAGISWDAPMLNGGDFNPEVDVGSFSDSDYGRFGSFDSMDVSDPSTTASSLSESYIIPSSNAGVDSPGGKIQLQDLSLDEYFQAFQTFDASSSNGGNPISPTSPAIPEPFPFDNDYSAMQEWPAVGNMSVYNNEMAHWSSATITQPQEMQNFLFGQSSTSSQIPWSPQMTAFDVNANTGNVAFEPSDGPGMGAYLTTQEFLDTCQRDVTPQPAVSPTGDDSEYEGWQTVTFPSYANSSIPSQGSPHSAGSPFELIDTPHQTPSPPPQQQDHLHFVTLYPGITSPTQKLPRGRQRALTSKEKKEAREVRDAKACWACHLTKIKCSPCSPGSPCKKCAELIGKRRFCLLPCFNDPLESLYTFMVPDYLMGHYTKASVEQFISNNATGWGSHEMRIRMMWGYCKPLEVVVVSLEIHQDSEMGIHRQTIADGTHVQKTSPPLGIPLAAIDDMQDEYRLLVQSIVQDDLVNYLPVPYDDQDSMFPERLLTSLGTYYCDSKAAGAECELLRQALEIHVTSTILERSLILDEASMQTVESHLNMKYSKRTAARCAMRQVKLAFFEVQQKRIAKVLETWGSMMWTSNRSTSNDRKWATTFSVFLALILSTDKTLGLAYYFCEGRIANKGYAASSERRRFQELVRLTQAELFERCKEIFHSSFKTRKNGKEACNPIRDGLVAFKDDDVNKPLARFVSELRAITREFGREIKSHRPLMPEPSGKARPYTNAGRLACIFLDDFLDH